MTTGCGRHEASFNPNPAPAPAAATTPSPTPTPTPTVSDDAFAETTDATGAAIFARICVTCHGAAGHGKRGLSAPSIAGLPAWYTRAQFRSFEINLRGAHPEDGPGVLMRSVATRMSRPMVDRVTEHVATLPPLRTVATLGGDAAAGLRGYDEHCIGCHRYDASGDKVFASPPLRVLPDWYMLEQMRKYHSGARGAASDDEPGQKMARVAEYVNDPTELRDILARVAELAQTR